MAELVLAEHQEGDSTVLIAGSLFLRLGDTVFYAFNGRDDKRLDLRPNEAIQWYAIEAASRDGFSWYDLGEADEGGSLAAFKSKWATDQEWMVRYYSCSIALDVKDAGRHHPALELAKNAWLHLPLVVTAKLGMAAIFFL
jgi:lipid II:glycine glycyltransferase (peptidoglycan interpeptide bridge formation enzyme)